MPSDKANAICLLNILRDYSDGEHIMPMGEIIKRMESVYGLRPDRRTVTSAIETLQTLGFDISPYGENHKGYWLRGRKISEKEVRLLMDAVYSFSFLSARETSSLLGKLQQFLSVYSRKKYKNLAVIREEKKSQNKHVFDNIDLLDKAISKKVQVSFYYLAYGLDKKLHPRRLQRYVVNPYGMIFTNEHYYLNCTPARTDKTSLYRIDRIDKLAIEQSEIDTQEPKFNCRKQIKNVVYAHVGWPEPIAMLCSKSILDDVIDKFGSGVWLKEQDQDTVRVRFTAPPRGVKYWALQYLEHVEVTEPAWLREEIIKAIGVNKYGVKQ